MERDGTFKHFASMENNSDNKSENDELSTLPDADMKTEQEAFMKTDTSPTRWGGTLSVIAEDQDI